MRLLSFLAVVRVLCVCGIAVGLAGCASVTGETADRWLSVHENDAPASPPPLWVTESTVYSKDGIQSGGVGAVATEIADLVNQGFIREWYRQFGANALDGEAVPTGVLKEYGHSVTLPGAAQAGEEWLVRVICRLDESDWPRGASVIRHESRFEVFTDTVELQLFSVLTVTDARGVPQWQGGVRSKKRFDSWAGGDSLAALSAKFVAESVRENARNLTSLYGTSNRRSVALTRAPAGEGALSVD